MSVEIIRRGEDDDGLSSKQQKTRKSEISFLYISLTNISFIEIINSCEMRYLFISSTSTYIPTMNCSQL